MRTTLEIANDVFYIAKDHARHDKKTIGQVISDWARQGLHPPVAPSAKTSRLIIYKNPERSDSTVKRTRSLNLNFVVERTLSAVQFSIPSPDLTLNVGASAS